MSVIVDSCVLISALVTNGVVRRIIVGNPAVWVTPEAMLDEIWEHRDAWNRNKLSDKDLREILDALIEDFVIVASENVYKDSATEAKKLVSDIDDWPLVALARSLDNEGLWTFNEKHFRKAIRKGLVLLNTSDIVAKYRPMSEKNSASMNRRG